MEFHKQLYASLPFLPISHSRNKEPTSKERGGRERDQRGGGRREKGGREGKEGRGREGGRTLPPNAPKLYFK